VSSGVATFSSTSSGAGSASSYYWNFGDGNSSTLQNPVHSYLNAGSHIVKLRVTNSASSICRDSSIQSVNITGIACNANSGFSVAPTNTALIWNAIPAYPWNVSAATWDWGDGSSSNVLYTSHQYSAAGVYNICLSVTVSCVASSSTCTSYSVYRSTQQAAMIEIHVIEPELISGIEKQTFDQEHSLRIIPNPNNGDFSLSLAGFGNDGVLIEVRDLAGRLIHSENINTTGDELTPVVTRDLEPGIYFVTVASLKTNATIKMIVSD
jgi:PKD repeat protein